MKDPLTDLGAASRRASQPSEADRVRSRRNWVMLVALLAFVVLVFVITIVKLRGNVAHF
jgi:hypothetical protein